jgi:hypothetical protein
MKNGRPENEPIAADLVEEPLAIEEEAEAEAALSAAIEPAFAAIQWTPKESLVDQLQRMEDAALIFDRRCQLLETCRISAIRATQPEDWVLSKPKGSDAALGMLKKSGAEVVAMYFGVKLRNIRPTGPDGEFKPQKVVGAEGVSYRLWGDAFCEVTGREIENLEASRTSTEDFVGRTKALTGASDLVQDADLRMSAYTLLQTKAVRILAGMSRVPIATLDAAWEGTPKSSDRCEKGSGFGSGKGRRSTKVSKTDAASRDELWNEIQRATGGDIQAAKDLLREISANPEKGFKGFDDIERFTQDWQIKRAFEALKAHPVFGGES